MANTTVKRVKQAYWAGNTFIPQDSPGLPSLLGSADPNVIAAYTEDVVIASTT